MASAASNHLWDEDPSPSMDEVAAVVGVEAPLAAPGECVHNVDLANQLYWPMPPYGADTVDGI